MQAEQLHIRRVLGCRLGTNRNIINTFLYAIRLSKEVVMVFVLSFFDFLILATLVLLSTLYYYLYYILAVLPSLMFSISEKGAH